jgi:glycosyltransferase involved in cell wall biosynthesis
MRVAYFAHYQGDDIIARRRLRRNISLAGSQKMRLIGSMLVEIGHEVTIFSTGSVAERRPRIHKSFSAHLDYCANVEVHYSTAFDMPLIGQAFSSQSLWQAFKAEHTKRPFNLVLVYNCSVPETYTALRAKHRFDLPTILEYEDDVGFMQDGSKSWRNTIWTFLRTLLQPRVSGIVAATPELMAQFGHVPGVLLRGALDSEYVTHFSDRKSGDSASTDVVYSGSITDSKGVDRLCAAWKQLALKSARLHVVGHGPALPKLKQQFGPRDGICFHGYVDRGRLLEILTLSKICVNPNRVNAAVSGNVFPFKLVEYLGAGRPVVSTPLGSLEPELAQAIFTTKDDSIEALAAGIESIVNNYALWAAKAKIAQRAIRLQYEPGPMKRRLAELICEVAGPHD